MFDLVHSVPIYESDAGNTAAPHVKVKYLSAREEIKLWALVDEAEKLEKQPDLEGAAGKLVEAIGVFCQSVDNLQGVTSAADLLGTVSYELLWDLACRCPRETSKLERAKRKPASSPPVAAA